MKKDTATALVTFMIPFGKATFASDMHARLVAAAPEEFESVTFHPHRKVGVALVQATCPRSVGLDRIEGLASSMAAAFGGDSIKVTVHDS